MARNGKPGRPCEPNRRPSRDFSAPRMASLSVNERLGLVFLLHELRAYFTHQAPEHPSARRYRAALGDWIERFWAKNGAGDTRWRLGKQRQEDRE